MFNCQYRARFELQRVAGLVSGAEKNPGDGTFSPPSVMVLCVFPSPADRFQLLICGNFKSSQHYHTVAGRLIFPHDSMYSPHMNYLSNEGYRSLLRVLI